MTALPAVWARLAVDALVPRPWKNGGGVTREIAAFPSQAGGQDFDWRVSVADITANGPFSRFDGIDRQIVLLSGAGVRLAARDGSFDHTLDAPCRPFAFAGETPVQATLLGGASRDLNVMTRRGRYRAVVTAATGGFACTGAAARIVLATVGTWQVRVGQTSAVELPAGSALVLRGDEGNALRGEDCLRCDAAGSTPPAVCIHIAIHAEEAQ